MRSPQKVHLMRHVLSFLPLTLLLTPSHALDNEAEKLFRGREQKLRTAKPLQLCFDLSANVVRSGNLKSSGQGNEGNVPFCVFLRGFTFPSISVSGQTIVSVWPGRRRLDDEHCGNEPAPIATHAISWAGRHSSRVRLPIRSLAGILDFATFSLTRAVFVGSCHEIYDLIVADVVQPFMALTSVIAGTLMVKLDIANGVCHA
jgi:hypothetical protein